MMKMQESQNKRIIVCGRRDISRQLERLDSVSRFDSCCQCCCCYHYGHTLVHAYLNMHILSADDQYNLHVSIPSRFDCLCRTRQHRRRVSQESGARDCTGSDCIRPRSQESAVALCVVPAGEELDLAESPAVVIREEVHSPSVRDLTYPKSCALPSVLRPHLASNVEPGLCSTQRKVSANFADGVQRRMYAYSKTASAEYDPRAHDWTLPRNSIRVRVESWFWMWIRTSTPHPRRR